MVDVQEIETDFETYKDFRLTYWTKNTDWSIVITLAKRYVKADYHYDLTDQSDKGYKIDNVNINTEQFNVEYFDNNLENLDLETFKEKYKLTEEEINEYVEDALSHLREEIRNFVCDNHEYFD